MRVLVTGAAGFLGLHCTRALITAGAEVYGLDALVPDDDAQLKLDRLNLLLTSPRFRFLHTDITDFANLADVYEQVAPDKVLHLAALPGIRASVEHPERTTRVNVLGFQNILELVRRHAPQHFVYASASSVYGARINGPMAEADALGEPLNPYAASKRANELLASSYASLFGINATGLRLFTVYGPFCRPDMAVYRFAKKIRDGDPITLFESGALLRDLTYIDDAVAGILAALDRPERGAIYNIGGGQPVMMRRVLTLLEERLGAKARLQPRPKPAEDMAMTWAATAHAADKLGYQPKTRLEVGLDAFVRWFETQDPR